MSSRNLASSPRVHRVVAAVSSFFVLLTLLAGPARAGAQFAPTANLAPDQAPASAIALAAEPSGFDFAFYRGQDGAVYHRIFRDGLWSAETTIGGRIVGAPAAAYVGTTLVVAGRGTDNALWLRIRQGGVWGPWHTLGGELTAGPAVTASPDGRIDVFARGADNGLWTRSMPSGGPWSGWFSLNGDIRSGPAAVVANATPTRVDVYAVGRDGAVWGRSRTSGSWSPWRSFGGATVSAPAAAPNPAGGPSWVFVRGTNNALYVNTSGGTSWQSLGGALIDAPGATGIPTRVDVVVRGTDSGAWANVFRDGAWSGWIRGWTPT